MTEPALHLFFSLSAAATFRDTFKQAGSNDEVIGFPDCLSFGPIDYTDPKTRARWVDEDLGYDPGWEDVLEESEAFWNRAISDPRRKVLWTSRRSAEEHAGFLECLWRLGNAPCSVADVTDTTVISNRDGAASKSVFVISPALLYLINILENGILDLIHPITQEERDRYHAVWKRLRAENAPFRVIEKNELISAPITYFDEFIHSCVINEWRKSARVIGEALSREMDNEIIQTGDLVLFARLRKLADLGVLDSQGDMSQIHHSEVRLKSAV